MVRRDGWIISSTWIDHEDLFTMCESIKDQKVKSDEWNSLPIITEH